MVYSKKNGRVYMKIKEFTIDVGASSQFSMLHMSDNHITLADSRDCEEKIKLAKRRTRSFDGRSNENDHMKLSEELVDYAEAKGLTILHTGDMIDFVSEANLDYVRNEFRNCDVFMAAGNHEYSQFVGEAWEDEEYKAQTFDRVCAAFPGDIWFQVRIVNGVKFIAIDNNYYYVTEEQLRLFRREVSDGMPTVLLVHNPIYSTNTYEVTMGEKCKDEPPYLFGCPEFLLRGLSENRYNQQKPSCVTSEFVQLCENLPNLKAVLSGHLHESAECKLNSGITQYIAGPAYLGEANLYSFI